MTRDPKLQALYGFKFNPFLPNIPSEALYHPPLVSSFISRCESHMNEGGFALLTGASGLGKSATLRLLSAHLSRIRDVMVRSITYPQCRIGDLYGELGDAFGVALRAGNRWGSFKLVREKWQEHLASTRTRPVIIIDEAQALAPAVLQELRLITSKEFDSQSLVFIVLAGDLRLADNLRDPALLPIDSRLRIRVRMEPASVPELQAYLEHVLEKAGNSQLFTSGALAALVEHSTGSPRAMMLLANDLLHVAVSRELRQIDEKLFFEVFAIKPPPRPEKKRR